MSNVGLVIKALLGREFVRNNLVSVRIEAEGCDWIVTRKAEDGIHAVPDFQSFTDSSEKEAFIKRHTPRDGEIR